MSLRSKASGFQSQAHAGHVIRPSVGRMDSFFEGEIGAHKRLQTFVEKKISGYAIDRNDRLV